MDQIRERALELAVLYTYESNDNVLNTLDIAEKFYNFLINKKKKDNG